MEVVADSDNPQTTATASAESVPPTPPLTFENIPNSNIPPAQDLEKQATLPQTLEAVPIADALLTSHANVGDKRKAATIEVPPADVSVIPSTVAESATVAPNRRAFYLPTASAAVVEAGSSSSVVVLPEGTVPPKRPPKPDLRYIKGEDERLRRWEQYARRTPKACMYRCLAARRQEHRALVPPCAQVP